MPNWILQETKNENRNKDKNKNENENKNSQWPKYYTLGMKMKLHCF